MFILPEAKPILYGLIQPGNLDVSPLAVVLVVLSVGALMTVAMVALGVLCMMVLDNALRDGGAWRRRSRSRSAWPRG